MNKIFFSAMAIISILALTACGPSASSPDLASTRWELVTLNGKPAVENVVADLALVDKKAGGNTGCNTYGGSYEQNGSKLTFGNMVSTMMACPDPVMQQESDFLAVLAATAAFTLENDILTLKDTKGVVLATFKPYESAPLTGVTWQAIAINNGKQAVESVPTGVEITALFGDDGSLSGMGGCNNYRTTYTVDGDKIAIDPKFASTKMACPPEVQEQEDAYLSALAKAVTFNVDKSSLELRGTEGELLADFQVK